MNRIKPYSVVLYVVDGITVFGGIAEYLTPDGWVGIRQWHAGGRLDEAPLRLCKRVQRLPAEMLGQC